MPVAKFDQVSAWPCRHTLLGFPSYLILHPSPGLRGMLNCRGFFCSTDCRLKEAGRKVVIYTQLCLGSNFSVLKVLTAGYAQKYRHGELSSPSNINMGTCAVFWSFFFFFLVCLKMLLLNSGKRKGKNYNLKLCLFPVHRNYQGFLQ